MNETTTSSPSRAAARELLKALQSQYPALRDNRPLAIGIDAELHTALPDTDRKTLKIALKIHTNSTRYLKALASEKKRYSLTGEAVADLDEEHRKRAQAMLEERHKRREQQERERREQAAESRRTEKLQQLAARFSRDNK